MLSNVKKNNLYYFELIKYISILTFSLLCLFVAKLTLSNSLIIHAKTDHPDFLQVFFPENSIYNEKNSVRSDIFGSSITKIKIPFYNGNFDRIRIDPGNKAGQVLIEKIEIRYLFNTEIYNSVDLEIASKAIQMIDKLEATPAGLLVRSTGNDPVFELKIRNNFQLTESINLIGIGILISVVIFLMLKILENKKIIYLRKMSFSVIIPLFISGMIAFLFYPGFMSYDSMHALRSARNGVTDSMWPPMVSYVWRAINVVSFNPVAMHFSQLFLLIFSVYFIALFFSKKIIYATSFLLIYLSIPVVLGTVTVIWKDVLMAAFFFAGFLVIIFSSKVHSGWRFISLSVLAIVLIFLGVCSRHNAITGAVPLIFYLAWIYCSRIFKTPSRLWFSILILGAILTGSVFSAKIFLDNYSLPSFEKLPNSSSEFIQTVRILDIAGASLCLNDNMFSELAPILKIEDIRKKYDPRHINLSHELFDSVDLKNKNEIDKVWMNIAIHHPVCFLSNKFEMTKYLIGANEGRQFIITAPSIDNNEYGYKLAESTLRESIVNYIVNYSEVKYFKPWFLYLLSIISFIYLIRIKAMTPAAMTIFTSGIFYFGGLVIFGNAADARLLFYTTTAILIIILISIVEFIKRIK